ncbi:glycosyltransferase family 39 protein [Patescibacteria group bacterium]|nr:glycosyltransferase family 39 protein [Patescibacteria group bacterium]MBU1868475.1 glycosyltransferase family 39 protein [Patescibacteria group bacterium]
MVPIVITKESFKWNIGGILAVVILVSVFALVIFALLMRGLPPGLNHDAAWNGLYAKRILNGEPFTVYTTEAWGRETFFHYFLAIFFRVFGSSKAAIIGTTAFFGGLSVVFFFLLMLTITNQKSLSFGLSILWLLSPALVVYSLAGWRLITLIPFVILLALFSQKYLERAAMSNAIGVGITSAIIFYTYNAGRSVVLYLIVFWLGCMLKGDLTRRLKHCLVSCLCFLIFAAPMLSYAFHNWSDWMGRAKALSDQLSPETVIGNIQASFRFYNFDAKGNDFLTNFPVLAGPVAVLWMVGLVISLIKPRRFWIYVLLFSTFLLPSVFSVPSFHRAIGTLAVVYVLASIAVFVLWNCFSKLKVPRWLLTLLFASLVVFQGLSSIARLFVRQDVFAWGFYPDATVVGEYLHGLEAGEIIVYAGNWPQDILTFLSLEESSSVSPKFKNYQSYNTLSRDGITELRRDFLAGQISPEAYFIVDTFKLEDFVEAFAEIGYSPLEEVKIRDRQGNVIAVRFSLNSYLLDE